MFKFSPTETQSIFANLGLSVIYLQWNSINIILSCSKATCESLSAKNLLYISYIPFLVVYEGSSSTVAIDV